MQIQRLACFFLMTAAIPILASGADHGEAITDVKAAGPDYALQGEYKGSLKMEEGQKAFGTQVIALGDDKYQVVGYPGGLPGDGWARGDELHRVDATAEDGKIRFQVDGADIVVGDGQITVSVEGKSLGTLKKVERKSPTLGAKPPAGATVLFDGSSADQFEGGKLVEGKWLGATNCASKLKLGDHTMHIEFRTPYMPHARGQGRGNSGVYLQSRYELQVLDSFGLEGKDNECGGIYSISPPIVNMCLPPLTWQTYDIDFTAAKYDDAGNKLANARVTVKHNGVAIHDDRELSHGTPGRNKEAPGADALFLQNHGNPVVFRNIWVVQK